MRRNKIGIVIEVMFHALFWLGMYYALRALTVSNFKVLYNNNGRMAGPQRGDALFPYNKQVLLFLMVLFYSGAFWLFGKAVAFKNKFLSAGIISGWALLLYTLNFYVIQWLIFSHGAGHVAVNTTPPAPDPGLPAPPGGTTAISDWPQLHGTLALVFLSVLGIAIAYFFSKQWIRNDLVRSKVKSEQLSAELRYLRGQVNPHFLFNTLNNLFSMAQKKGDEELAGSISKLSGMMRYMIYESDNDKVPLHKEIGYLEDCIALNKLRYADSEVAVNFQYPAAAVIATVQVAPMIFIPFLENALKHGVAIGQVSNVDMAIAMNENKLIFTCVNTDYSSVKRWDDEKGGIGLENVKRRLELVYPGKHELVAGTDREKYRIKLQIDLA